MLTIIVGTFSRFLLHIVRMLWPIPREMISHQSSWLNCGFISGELTFVRGNLNLCWTQEPWIMRPHHLPGSYQHLGSVRLSPLRPCHHILPREGVITYTSHSILLSLVPWLKINIPTEVEVKKSNTLEECRLQGVQKLAVNVYLVHYCVCNLQTVTFS